MKKRFDKNVIQRYLKSMEEDKFHRYWSWDHCFKSFSENSEKNLALSLASYLASWGMYRGSGGLLQKNYRVHEEAIKIIHSDKFVQLRCSEKKEVNRSKVNLILDLKYSLGSYYKSLQFVRKQEVRTLSDTDTLLSKIMLGATGCVPAYDRFLIAGMKICNYDRNGFNKNNLEKLFDFIETDENLIKECQEFSRKITGMYYPIMKIIDMYFWQLGYEHGIR